MLFQCHNRSLTLSEEWQRLSRWKIWKHVLSRRRITTFGDNSRTKDNDMSLSSLSIKAFSRWKCFDMSKHWYKIIRLTASLQNLTRKMIKLKWLAFRSYHQRMFLGNCAHVRVALDGLGDLQWVSLDVDRSPQAHCIHYKSCSDLNLGFPNLELLVSWLSHLIFETTSVIYIRCY